MTCKLGGTGRTDGTLRVYLCVMSHASYVYDRNIDVRLCKVAENVSAHFAVLYLRLCSRSTSVFQPTISSITHPRSTFLVRIYKRVISSVVLTPCVLGAASSNVPALHVAPLHPAFTTERLRIARRRSCDDALTNLHVSAKQRPSSSLI